MNNLTLAESIIEEIIELIKEHESKEGIDYKKLAQALAQIVEKYVEG